MPRHNDLLQLSAQVSASCKRAALRWGLPRGRRKRAGPQPADMHVYLQQLHVNLSKNGVDFSELGGNIAMPSPGIRLGLAVPAS